MKVLVDTCVWIEHFKTGVSELSDLLRNKQVLTHSSVIGELACGKIPDRVRVLGDLLLLDKAVESTHLEVLNFIEQKKLFGRGLGWVDCHLLVSAKISDARVYTFDKQLKRFA